MLMLRVTREPGSPTAHKEITLIHWLLPSPQAARLSNRSYPWKQTIWYDAALSVWT
jgi:hypothetical protein